MKDKERNIVTVKFSSTVLTITILSNFSPQDAFAQCINTATIPEFANQMAMPNCMPGQFTGQLAMQMPFLPAPSFSIFADGLVVDGIVSVTGSLPFLGTVTLGGTLPANGQGSVVYSCGNGEVGIFNERPMPVEIPAVRSMPAAAVLM